MRIVWLPKAKSELQQIWIYYTEAAGSGTADKLLARIVAAADILLDHPYVGLPSQSTEGVRELLVGQTAYTLPYRVIEDRVEILRVFDNRRKPVEKWE